MILHVYSRAEFIQILPLGIDFKMSDLGIQLWIIEIFDSKSSHCQRTTLDGRNPARAKMMLSPVFPGSHASRVVQDPSNSFRGLIASALMNFVGGFLRAPYKRGNLAQKGKARISLLF